MYLQIWKFYFNKKIQQNNKFLNFQHEMTNFNDHKIPGVTLEIP